MDPPLLKMSTFVTLPKDLIIEILLRLPVKSLQRFKCVAKSWNAFINDPRFVINYFFSSNNHLLLINQLHTEKKQVLSLLSSEPLEIKTKHFRLSYANSIEETNSAACILGPCNGIICLFDTLFFEGDTISLWNPRNQQLKTLPKSHVVPPRNAIPLKRIVGLGFDDESNDYKVLAYKHMYFPSSPSTPTTAHAELYTLSTNSWKEIYVGEEFQPMCCQTTRATNPSSVNEIFSWLEIENHIETVIFSFNIKNEAFIKTKLPHNPFNINHGTLAPLKDSLAYIQIHYVRNGVHYHVWVLGEYGVRESWMKQLTIGPIFGKTSALGFWKNGELLLQDITKRKLISCDLITRDMKDIQARGVFSILKVLPYKESLFCFKEDEEVTDQNTLSVTEC